MSKDTQSQYLKHLETYLKGVFEETILRPKGLAWGKWIGDLMDLGPDYKQSLGLYPSELELIKKAVIGEWCRLGNRRRPDKACEDEERFIRGGVIACLAQN